MKLSDIGELGWINRVRARVPSKKSAVLAGIGDDSAWLKTPDSSLLTCDLLIEDVHFIKSVHPPRLLGRKALSVNLSDIAAMAGIPEYALIGVGFPSDTELEYAEELIEGFLEVAQEQKVELIGGDTTLAEKLTLSVIVLGRPAWEKPVFRSGAQPEDEVWVTGTIGDAGLGFQLLKKSREEKLELPDLHHSSLVVKHFDPEARVSAGIKLGKFAHSMIDLSDGLLVDLGHILEESGREKTLRALIHLDLLPMSKEFIEHYAQKPMENEEALRILLSGGEDYELLFTASPEAEPEIHKLSQELDLRITRVGKIEEAQTSEVVLLDKKGAPIKAPRLWFEHFPKENPSKL